MLFLPPLRFYTVSPDRELSECSSVRALREDRPVSLVASRFRCIGRTQWSDPTMCWRCTISTTRWRMWVKLCGFAILLNKQNKFTGGQRRLLGRRGDLGPSAQRNQPHGAQWRGYGDSGRFNYSRSKNLYLRVTILNRCRVRKAVEKDVFWMWLLAGLRA